MRNAILLAAMAIIIISITAFRDLDGKPAYFVNYFSRLEQFREENSKLIQVIGNSDLSSETGIDAIKTQISTARTQLKLMDFWFRYLEPIMYKKINSPLPVEWETEVFEKFEKPYKREGAGLTLAELYLDEDKVDRDSLLSLVRSSLQATETFMADSITTNLKSYQHFFLCNRLYLLNLASIYTTGFECPDTSRIIPELREMLSGVQGIYDSYNASFPETQLGQDYLSLYQQAVSFVQAQPLNYSQFDHFVFLRDYINPLFKINQQYLNSYKVVSRSFVDYSLTKTALSMFDKKLYNGQNAKGIFLRVTDERALEEIRSLGKLFFFDPILSGNNKRSCASCHKPTECFSDTIGRTAFKYDHNGFLPRNTPSLVNVQFNHLVMLDGEHISLQNQTKAVVENTDEMGGSETDVLKKVLSCPDYKRSLVALLKYTPTETEVTFEHISSAITYYYSQFSNYFSPFDNAMNDKKNIAPEEKAGFNIFMSKAQCGTCHFVPQFNGVKPPYVGSEFEVLGVPADTGFIKLSPDSGRYRINPAGEMLNAFRTGSLRNSTKTAPYMHNGVFGTLEQVVDFYDAGGGAGRGLHVTNQTLSSDSLRLTAVEKRNLIRFIRSLDEDIHADGPPAKLPASKNKNLNTRKIGGEY